METMETNVTLLTDSRQGIVGRVNDVFKASWDVHEVRPTKHGFDLYFGLPRTTYLPCYGTPHLIVTKDLRKYWHANRTKPNRFFLDLPACHTSVDRALKVLRHIHREDVKAFWAQRLGDLAGLPTRDFAAKYGVDPRIAFKWRLKLVRRQRPAGWWRTPEILRILSSTISLAEVGRELGIAMSEVARLQRLAKKEAQT